MSNFQQVFRVEPTAALGKFELEMVRRFPAKMKLAGDRAGREGARLLAGKSWKIRDLGSFRASWSYSSYVISKGIVVDFLNRAPHSVFVLKGRRAGAAMPPYKPIYEWVMRNIGDPRAVYPIRRKIAVKGIQARPVLAENRERLVEIVSQHYEDAWQSAAKEASRA